MNFYGKSIIEAPYVVSDYRQGKPLSDVFDELDLEDKRQMAISLGNWLAAFHAIHQPNCPTEKLKGHSRVAVVASPVTSVMPASVDDNRENDHCVPFENLRSVMHWLELNVTSQGTFFQAQDASRVWSQSLNGMLSVMPSLNEDADQTSLIPGTIRLKIGHNSETVCGAWYPFIAFINWRLRIVRHIPSETQLPEQLLPQLHSYLPPTAEALFSWTDTTEGTAPFPSYLHGDLTHDNILMSTSNSQAHPCIIDFGDASHGDPLYDFVALYLSSLRSDPALLSAFIQSYSHTFKQSAPDLWSAWLGSRCHLPSYYAMCYTLLHEDNTLGWLLQSHPQHQHITSLSQLEITVWGALNEAVHENCPDRNCHCSS